MRLFVGVELSDDVRAALASIARDLAETGADARWTKPSKFHVTLQFLGEADETKRPAIASALDEAANERRPFAFSLAGLGAFPEAKRPLVVWAGVGAGREPFERAAASLGTRLSAIGFPPDSRKYTPHVTLGRIKSGPSTSSGRAGLAALRSVLKSHSQTPFGSCEASSFALFLSRPGTDGSEYEVLSRHGFAAP